MSVFYLAVLAVTLVAFTAATVLYLDHLRRERKKSRRVSDRDRWARRQDWLRVTR